MRSLFLCDTIRYAVGSASDNTGPNSAIPQVGWILQTCDAIPSPNMGLWPQVTLQSLHTCLAMFLFAYIAGAVYPSPYQETRLGVSTTSLSLVHIPMFPTLIHVIRTMKCSTTSHFLSRGQGCSNPSWINYSNLLWGKNVFILHLLNLTPKRRGGGLGASLEEEEKFLEQRPKLSSQGSGSGAATDHVWQEGLRVRLLVPDPFWRAWLASLAVDCKVIPSGNQRKSPFRMGI